MVTTWFSIAAVQRADDAAGQAVLDRARYADAGSQGRESRILRRNAGQLLRIGVDGATYAVLDLHHLADIETTRGEQDRSHGGVAIADAGLW